MKYATLVRILDAICKEAPTAFKRYRPDKGNNEKVTKARALALVHLFLKVKFGLIDFSSRSEFITDDTGDGGLDGYYVDDEAKNVFMIQSKFRATENNFEEKEITPEELLQMEVGRITKGQVADSKGNEFNGKIRNFQRRLQDTRDIARYRFKIIILANLKRYTDEQIRRLVENFEYEIFDFARIYKELVFPVCTGTYFDADQIEIKLELLRKHHPQLFQEVETLYGPSELRMIYVPLVEIAKAVARYKNALLSYNPRNFLSLTKNPVNQSIQSTALEDTKNAFALLNNGITVLCEESSMTDRTGTKGVGQLVIVKPQIINGGQTACTLAQAWDMASAENEKKMEGKEVLLKVVSQPKGLSAEKIAEFIELISEATNQQTRIFEADRRANDAKMRRIQDYFYESHGLFLERKKGEFWYGLQDKYLAKADVVDRVDLIRNYVAFSGAVAKARSSQTTIFEESEFETLLKTFDERRIFLSYAAANELTTVVKSLRTGTRSGFSAGYARYAVLAAAGIYATQNASSSSIKVEAAALITKATGEWAAFEAEIQQDDRNAKYKTEAGFSFDNYYKGETVDVDVQTYFTAHR